MFSFNYNNKTPEPEPSGTSDNYRQVCSSRSAIQEQTPIFYSEKGSKINIKIKYV